MFHFMIKVYYGSCGICIYAIVGATNEGVGR
jgi:hypothetical protein